MTYLEWNDWVEFHSIVNGVLDEYHISANVWSNPQDVRGKMWIRKADLGARVRYDWEENLDRSGRVERIWNQGTPDQFYTAGFNRC
jgi:hypothetical protein